MIKILTSAVLGVTLCVGLSGTSSWAGGVSPEFESTSVIRARAYIALGDQLYGQWTETKAQLLEVLKRQGISYDGTSGMVGLTGEAASLYDSMKSVSLDAGQFYQKIFGADYGLPGFDPMNLPAGYNFLNRQAYNKWYMLQSGLLPTGSREKGPNLYAVNAEFKGDLLSRSSLLVEDLDRLEGEYRRLKQAYNEFIVTRVDDNGDLQGTVAAKLSAENYTRDRQTQLARLTAEYQSLDQQQADEVDEITRKASSMSVVQALFTRNFDNVEQANGPMQFGGSLQISPQSNIFVMLPQTFAAGSLVSTKAQGTWSPKGVTQRFLDNSSNWSGDSAGGYSNPATYMQAKKLPEVQEAETKALQLISQGAFCDADGMKITTSAGTSASVGQTQGTTIGSSQCSGTSHTVSSSDGYSNTVGGSGGLPYLQGSYSHSWTHSEGTADSTSANSCVSDSTSQSTTVSSGTNHGTSMTVSFTASNADLIYAPIGGLIGAWFDGAQMVDKPFFVGGMSMMVVPSIPGNPNLSLGLMMNDAAGMHEFNVGTMGVQYTFSTKFLDFLPKFSEWLFKTCDVPIDGSQAPKNCGLMAILDNIAYFPDPVGFAFSALSALELSYPVNLQPIDPRFKQWMTEMVKAIVDQKIAERDLSISQHRHDLTSLAAITARNSRDLAVKNVENAAIMAANYDRQFNDQISKHGALLALARDYYESELASLERVRMQISDRVERYMGITVDSYNYLYMQNYEISGAPLRGFEAEYYREHLNRIKDQVFGIDVHEDLLNPNRGYLVYDLPVWQVDELKQSHSTVVNLSPDSFFCQGYGIEDQVRVQVEKVGYLLDIDPLNEQRFFKNPAVRRMAIRTTHDTLNRHYNLAGDSIDFFLPLQTKEIYGYTKRTLTDYHSDYIELGLSNLFSRASFRNTSYVTNWAMELLDTDNFDLQYLNGVQFIIYFASTEAQNGRLMKTCLSGPLASHLQRVRWN